MAAETHESGVSGPMAAMRYNRLVTNTATRLRVHQLLDAIRDALRGLAQLPDRPVSGIALRDILGRRMVDQPLGQRVWQHQLALRHRDEAVASTALIASARAALVAGATSNTSSQSRTKLPASEAPRRLFARGGMEELGQGLKRQHTVALGRQPDQLDGAKVSLAPVAVDCVNQDVGVQ